MGDRYLYLTDATRAILVQHLRYTSGDFDVTVENMDIKAVFPKLVLESIATGKGENVRLQMKGGIVYRWEMRIELFKAVNLAKVEALCHMPWRVKTAGSIRMFGVPITRALPIADASYGHHFRNITGVVLHPGAGILPFPQGDEIDANRGGLRLGVETDFSLVIKEPSSHRLARSTLERILEFARMELGSTAGTPGFAGALRLNCNSAVLKMFNQRVSFSCISHRAQAKCNVVSHS